MIEYTSKRYIDGKIRQIIVDENGKIVNRRPNKDELKGLEEEKYKVNRKKTYTNKELLDYPIQFVKKYGRIPSRNDFNNNPEYPSSKAYCDRFGSWSNTLKLVDLDVESMARKGILETSDQKARYAEIKVIEHFKKRTIDLSGENRNSPCDGICPNGMYYEVKSSKLIRNMFWNFNTRNIYKAGIEIYYFLAFNEDWTKLEYVWRVPADIVEKYYFIIGLNYDYEFNVKNMKEYDITDKFKDTQLIL